MCVRSNKDAIFTQNVNILTGYIAKKSNFEIAIVGRACTVLTDDHHTNQLHCSITLSGERIWAIPTAASGKNDRGSVYRLQRATGLRRRPCL